MYPSEYQDDSAFSDICVVFAITKLHTAKGTILYTCIIIHLHAVVTKTKNANMYIVYITSSTSAHTVFFHATNLRRVMIMIRK